MGMEEYLKERQRRYSDEPRCKELLEVMRQANALVQQNEYRKLTGLVRHYKKSEDVVSYIACLLSTSYLFPTPEKTVETDKLDLMEALKDTYFMEKNGCRLVDISPEEADSVHEMLAMHTFMLDAYLKGYPESGLKGPSPEEVRSSVRILDYRRKEIDTSVLCDLAVYFMPTTRYVALRYGLADDFDMLDKLHRSEPGSYGNYGVVLESRLCRNAERAVENIKDVLLPDFYLERLDKELGKLGRIAASPDFVHNLIYVYPRFLAKYGIDKKSSATERSCQAEKAFRELDARFVRMTGRRPYADELFASIRCKKENMVEEKIQKQPNRVVFRKPPSKGRKMGL